MLAQHNTKHTFRSTLGGHVCGGVGVHTTRLGNLGNKAVTLIIEQVKFTGNSRVVVTRALHRASLD